MPAKLGRHRLAWVRWAGDNQVFSRDFRSLLAARAKHPAAPNALTRSCSQLTGEFLTPVTKSQRQPHDYHEPNDYDTRLTMTNEGLMAKAEETPGSVG